MKVPILLPKIFNHPFTYETNLKLRQALRKRKVKQRLINLKRKRTLRSGLYKGVSKMNK